MGSDLPLLRSSQVRQVLFNVDVTGDRWDINFYIPGIKRTYRSKFDVIVLTIIHIDVTKIASREVSTRHAEMRDYLICFHMVGLWIEQREVLLITLHVVVDAREEAKECYADVAQSEASCEDRACASSCGAERLLAFVGHLRGGSKAILVYEESLHFKFL